MKLYYPIEVDLFRPYPLPIMEAQQNNIGRGAQVTLKANGAIIQPTNEGLTFWAKKPDGTVSYLAATLSGANVQLDFTNQMLAVPGMVQVEIRMTSGDSTSMTDISTPIFNVRVNPSNISDGAVESSNEFTALLKSLGEIEELKKNGLKGDAATIEIGTVAATEPGDAPAVTNSGTSQAAVFDFVLPRGEQGPNGEAATVEVGTVEATDPGGTPTIKNTGTSQNAVFDFTLPRGEQGPKGEPGAPGKEQIVFTAVSAFPETGDPSMLYIDNTVSPAIIYTWSGSAYVQVSADISTVMAMLATPFSETESYTAGKYVTYNGQYWRFTADKTSGTWDASKAEATNIGTELSVVNTKISNITPDDTAVDGKPWTSKHIVDMLCPPLKVSGNPVQCYPVSGYPLGITASWEPTQEGTGDPSPDNIRPIKGRDSVEVERCGENLILFPYSSGIQEKNGLVIEPQQNGSIVVNGTALETTYYIFEKNLEKRVPLNTVMALSGCPVGGDLKNGYYIGLYVAGKWNVDIGTGNTNVICNSRNIGSRIEITIIKGTVCDNLIFWPKLEIGDKITPYCKYQGDTTTLTLPETIYGGSVDAVTGEGELQYNKVNIRMENLNYNINISAMLGYASQNLLNDIQLPSSNSIAFDGVCDCLPTKPASEINSGAIGFGVSASGDIYLKAEGLDSAEAYAAKFPNGVNVCYKVEIPTSFSAAGSAPVKALSGVNTVLTDADSAEVTGREDLIHVIAGQ